MSYSPFRHVDSILWKLNPIQLTLFLTKRCNAKCPFCFYLSQQQPSDKSPELTTDEISKISNNFGPLLWLAFSGGEIFLREDLVEISKLFYNKNQPAIMLFPTNGLRTDTIYKAMESILHACPKSNVVVKLSIDGPPSIHDPIRGVPGSFDKTMATYEALSSFIGKFSNFDMGINSVFCPQNQDHMEELLSFVKGLKYCTTHTVSLLRNSVSNSAPQGVDLNKYKQIINKMEADLKQKKASIYGFGGARLKAAQDILQRRLIHQTACNKTRTTPCYAGLLNLVISETGELFPCESFDMGMGNLRENGYDPKKILALPKSRRIMQSIKDKACFCTHECYFMTNILFNPRMYPSLFKEYLQL